MCIFTKMGVEKCMKFFSLQQKFPVEISLVLVSVKEG